MAKNGTVIPDNVTIKAVLRSTSALLLNPATEELLNSLRTKQPMTKRRDWSVREEAEGKLLLLDGKPFMPGQYLYSSLKAGGRHVPFGSRTKVSTATSTYLYSFVSDVPDELMLTNGNGSVAAWDPHFCRGRNPADKVMVSLVRPRFKKWAISLEFKATTKITPTIRIDLSKVRECFDVAGAMIGVGDFRPSCGGPFGRFEVAKWEVFTPDGELLDLTGVKPVKTAGLDEEGEGEGDLAGLEPEPIGPDANGEHTA